MAEICLNLLTKIKYSEEVDPLEKIWSLDNWSRSLDRVKSISVIKNTNYYQKFELEFDADRDQLDKIEVERFKQKYEIEVNHLTPPPGIISLTAKWWICPEQSHTLFAKRKLFIDSSIYTPQLAKKMFFMLRANLEKLIEPLL